MSERLRGRVAWSAADQALSSATNFAASVLIARYGSLVEFGQYAIAFTTYVVLLSAVRAATSEPLLIRFSAASADDRRVAARTALGLTLMLSLLIALTLTGLTIFMTGSVRTIVFTLGVIIAPLLLQDAYRFIFLASRQPAKAALNGIVWAAAQSVLTAIVIAAGAASPSTLMLAWGGGAAAASAFGTVQTRLMPSVRNAHPWIRTHRDLIPAFALEALTGNANRHGLIYVIGTLSGVAGAGKFRAGEIILGPMNVFVLGAVLAGIPEGARSLREQAQRLPSRVKWVAVGLSIGTLMWGLLAWLLPVRAGSALMGEAWVSGRSLLLPLTIGMAAIAANTALNGGMRVYGAAHRALRASMAAAPTMIIAVAVGSSAWGPTGAAYAFAGAGCLTTLLYVRQFSLAADEWQSANEPPGSHEPVVSRPLDV